MVRVAHQKSAKQANSSNGVRGSRVAKQRKNHKVVIESESQDQEKSRAVLSFRADPPPGYTFIPAGNPQLTAALKEFAKKGNHQILAVTTTPHATRHELSREVHRIGFHFPTEVVSQVCNHYGIRITSGGKLVEEKDDDKLFMRLYQRGQLVLDEKVRDQVTINTEAKQIIKDLFPNIPDNDLFQIIKTAFQLGDGKVGTADEIPLVRRAQLSVVAHIRHTYTSYDKLLRAVPYSEARHRVENITLQKLIDWRGDGQDDKQAMDDTLREVVVISDEEMSDDEIEEGQLLEHEDLRVQPVNRAVVVKGPTSARPRSPIEIISDEEAPRGYRYLPQVARRYPAQDIQAVSVARQQSRYDVWDRVRQAYRGRVDPQSSRVIERVLVDEPTTILSQASYVTREPLYVPEPLSRRLVEPAARIVSQPSPPTFVRGADGKLYERIGTYPDQTPASVSLRRPYTPPPSDYSRQYIDSRQVSPRPQPPRLHRRTESFENNDGIVLPSIESYNGIHAPPATRRNLLEDSRSLPHQRNSGFYESNQRQGQMIDLTNSAEQAGKRRRVEEAPSSPYLIRHNERGHNDYERGREKADTLYNFAENAHPSQQHRLIPLESPAVNYNAQNTYDRPDPKMQSTVVYREELTNRDVISPRGSGARYLPPANAREPYYVQSPRKIEYVNEYEHAVAPSHGEPFRQHISNHTTSGISDRIGSVILEERPLQGQSSDYHAEPISGYARTEVRNPFEAPLQTQHYVQDLPAERPQRKYDASAVFHYPPSRDSRTGQYQSNAVAYQSSEMAPPPMTFYRDEQNLRTTYIQN